MQSFDVVNGQPNQSYVFYGNTLHDFCNRARGDGGENRAREYVRSGDMIVLHRFFLAPDRAIYNFEFSKEMYELQQRIIEIAVTIQCLPWIFG